MLHVKKTCYHGDYQGDGYHGDGYHGDGYHGDGYHGEGWLATMSEWFEVAHQLPTSCWGTTVIEVLTKLL